MLNRLVARSGTCGINALFLNDLEGVEPPGIHLIRPCLGRDDKGLFLPKVTLAHHPRLSIVEPLRGLTATP